MNVRWLLLTLLASFTVSLADECRKISPHWEVSEPLSIEETEQDRLEWLRENRPDWPQVPFGRTAEEWERFKAQFTDDDVLVHVSIDAPPGLPHGSTAYVRLREGCVMDSFLLTT